MVTTGLALEVAALFAFAYATDTHVSPPGLTATTTVFVDGTKSLTGNESGGPQRMADSFRSAFDQGDHNVFISYPRSLGPATGPGDPTYDESEAIATARTVQAVKDAQATRQPGETIYVVGYSQGAGGASRAIDQLERDSAADGVDYTDGVQFVLGSDPRRNDGGILARLPAGVYLPIFGVTFGDGTSSQHTKVLQVTKQYDGVADAPNYIFNVVSDANAVMGYYYLHPGYYETVDPSADPNDPTRIVTYSTDRNVTDVLVKAPVGELPLTMPLRQLGVPPNVVAALDPFLRAVIETGYARPGVAPSQPVPFALVPPPSAWAQDAVNVTSGAVRTGQALGGVATTGLPAGGAATPPASPATAPAAQRSEPSIDEPAATAHSDDAPAARQVTTPRPARAQWQLPKVMRSLLNPTEQRTDRASPDADAPTEHAADRPTAGTTGATGSGERTDHPGSDGASSSTGPS
ncbi:PE-PPE domain-containing protein [Mycobacterium sp. MYCO198283]|uniref:PE-PPE domain-containing protein n=1 Tax=Mycobacterium sp. MYCO198283 TaxID=2883505 RepID=UPI001E4B9DD1|nr:PE-PPE domain-containing protein [Mycobacterium sp. MYCO198283]MCG5433511.1 PE-PPE domain-containing protein [Mycobacterium sp. MYCO198283]